LGVVIISLSTHSSLTVAHLKTKEKLRERRKEEVNQGKL
jgi:hypothetical protein